MFRRISYTIALQFTAFVLLFLLANGLIFLAADFGNARRQTQFRLERFSHLAERIQLESSQSIGGLPPMILDRSRITDAAGKTLFSGPFFGDIPFSRQQGISEVKFQNEEYAILTLPIEREGQVRGYLQIAELERLQFRELPLRALLYVLVSVAISALTFFVGLFFARRSLKPAEQMLERLEQFTQDASHELRTPLAALSSSLDLALKTEKYREGILSAKQDLKQVAVLVERLLELARLDKFVLKASDIDFSELVSHTVQRQRPFAEERGLSLEAHLEPDMHVTGDATLLRQVLENLVLNAIKFNKPQGRVIVRLTKEHLIIEDTGVGIAKSALPHIFDRFYQADMSRAKGGFGLGLALVKRIVELHGWSIGVKSGADKGTTFSIAFSARSSGADDRS